MAHTPAKHPKASRIERAETPIAFVNAVLLAYAKYRRDPSGVLEAARIAPSSLGTPTARVTASQFEALCRAAMQELDDEALGWFTRALPWGSYGLLCRASLGSPTLGVALKRWARHHRLLTDDIVFRLDMEGGIATLAIEEKRPLGAAREFCLVSSLRFVHGFACWLIDSRIPLKGVDFPIERPSHGDVHALIFPGPVRWSAARAGLHFDAQYLGLPPLRDEAALRSMLQHALPLTVLPYRRDRLLANRIRALMASRNGEKHDAASLARALGISVRTLHRQLREEGSSVLAIKNAARREQAIDLLRRTSRPIKQIAAATGFASDKTFTRAFKDWTGQAPADYRSRLRDAQR